MFIDRLIQTIGRLFGMYTQRTAAADCRNTAISDRMANAITAWYRLLYGEDVHDGYPVSKTRAAIFITNFAATLATEELEISTGTGARADFVKQQVARYVLPELHNNVQTAAAGGEVVLKPFIHNGRILCDAVTADRFYPTRINAAKEVEACYFTDYATYNGRDVVRVEFHDMRADGYYTHSPNASVLAEGCEGSLGNNHTSRQPLSDSHNRLCADRRDPRRGRELRDVAQRTGLHGQPPHRGTSRTGGYDQPSRA